MLVNNPNSQNIVLYTVDNKTNSIFIESGFANYNVNVIHPTQFVESYNGEVSGYSNTPDCLSLTDGATLTLNANKSCVYKFKVFWNSNLDLPTTTNYQIDYEFYPEGNISGNSSYCTTGVSNCANVIPYDSRNTLSYQSYNLKSQDNVVNQMGFSNFNFSYNGNKVLNWVQQNGNPNLTQTINTYNVNYNSSTNQLSLSGQQVFNNTDTSHGSYNLNYELNGWLSSNGSNFGSNFWNNLTFDNWAVDGVVGTNGNIYALNINTSYAYKSTTGDFINSQNYSQLNNSWSTSYNLLGVDETTNVAVLYKPSNRQNYCFNVNNGTYMDMTLSVHNSSKYIYQSVGTGQQFITTLNTINGELYGSTFGLYVQGQNGQYSIYSADNTAFLRKFDTVNCTISSNSKIYSFSALSGNSPVGGYTVINPSISNNYILSNSNLY